MAFGSFDIQDQPFNAMRRPRGIFSQPPVTNSPGNPPSVSTPGGASSGGGPQERGAGGGPLPLITGANPPTPLGQNGGQGGNFLSNVFNSGLGPQQSPMPPILGMGLGQRRMF
jgi:hypothetical protein